MSKVILKMRFKSCSPNVKSSISKNSSHVEYIATRAGVDKTITEIDLENELEGLKSENREYAKYISERPKSHGLFGAKGIENYKKVQKELDNKTNGFVWRGIISLREEDAVKLGYTDKEKWQDMLRKKMPDIAKEMNIPLSNLRWVAAIHMEKGHPHAHFMMWEKESQITLGQVPEKKLKIIRKRLTDEIFEDERLQYLTEKNLSRDFLKDLTEENISGMVKDLKVLGINQIGVPPRLYDDDEKIIKEKLIELSNNMPKKGRIAYKYMPEEIKKQVGEIADILLKQPEFRASLEKNLIATENLTKLYTSKEEDIDKARNNTLNDTKKRICQIILKGAVEIQKENKFYVDNKLSKKAINFIKNMDNPMNFNFVSEKAYGDIGKNYNVKDVIKKTISNLTIALLVSGVTIEETKSILNNWNEKSKSNINSEVLNEYIDKAYEKVEKNKNWGKETILSITDWKEMFENLGIREQDIPKWIYKSVDWQNNTYNVWKDVWKALESQRQQAEMEAEIMRRNLVKQESLNNKMAIKEQIKKNKNRSFIEIEEIDIL